MANPFNALSESQALQMAASPAMRERLMQTDVLSQQQVTGSVNNAVSSPAAAAPAMASAPRMNPWLVGGVAAALGAGLVYFFVR